MESKEWEYKEHFHAIGMTGDYSGHYEVSNGHISLCTNDDPEDITETENTLQRVAKALNESGCKFYCNTTTEHKLHIENMEIRYKCDELHETKQQADNLRKAYDELGREHQALKARCDKMEAALIKIVGMSVGESGPRTAIIEIKNIASAAACFCKEGDKS
jgi:hypothetical protein